MSEVVSASAKADANDYSRFDNIDDTDSDDESKKESTEEETLPIAEAIFKATTFKEAGNQAFKSNDLALAKASYSNGIRLLEKHKASSPPTILESQQKDVQALVVALNGNLSMIESKEENWQKSIGYANEVLRFDSVNVKALFRRGLAYFKDGRYEEGKFDLQRCLELDPTNAVCKKELAEAVRLSKEKQKKDKAMYGSMFSKGSIYEDREKERIAKEKREQEERERERDLWSQSKLERRSKGLEEQTFQEWKKERDDAKAKAIETKSTGPKPNPVSKSPAIPKVPKPIKSPKLDEGDDEYDEEDAKIIAETTSKGYCYFRNQQSTEVKELIGDITPKALDETTTPTTPLAAAAGAAVPSNQSQTPSSLAAAGNGSSLGIEASSWNHAGTWEERDVSETAKARLKELCLQATTELSGGIGSDPSDSSALMETMESMKVALAGLGENGTGATSSSLDALSASMSTFRGSVVNINKCDGEAQIVIARGKKRCVYDFNLALDFEIVVDDSWRREVDQDQAAGKAKKFKGSMTVPDVSPTMPIEPQVTFKKSVPPALEKKVKAAVEKLKDAVTSKIREFEGEYTV